MQTQAVTAAELDGLEGLSQKIEQWRNHRPRTRAMPEELWEQACEAARTLGVGHVSKALKLGYARLRERSSGLEVRRAESDRQARTASVASGEFVELSGFPSVRSLPGVEEAVVEVAAPDGTRLTIRLKGSTNVVALVNALRWRA